MQKSLFKLLIFTAIASITPLSLHAMEEKLTAENIASHQKFIILKDRLEEIGGTVSILHNRIGMQIILKSGNSYRSINYNEKNFWLRAEQVFEDFLREKTQLGNWSKHCQIRYKDYAS